MDWPTVLASVFGGAVTLAFAGEEVRKTISKLVAGTVDVPIAGLEALSDRIRNGTRASNTVQDAKAQAQAKRIISGDPLIDATAERLMIESIHKQQVRLDIAAKTLEHLRDDSSSEPTDGPSDDFLNFFSVRAEQASSEELKDLFARVLAGELRKPGSFSLSTIHFISIMDQRLARLIERVKPWISADSIIQNGDFMRGEKFLTIRELTDAGLFREVANTYTLGADGKLIIAYAGEGILLQGAPGSSFMTTIYGLTRAGQEVFSLVPASLDHAEMINLAQAWRAAAGNISVSRVNIIPLPEGRVNFFNERPV